MDEHLHERVREIVAHIPKGKVLTYGDVAELASAASARLVARILAEDSLDLDWQRVLRANGTCAPHIETEQLTRLRADGVIPVNGRVDLRRYRWHNAHGADPTT